MEFGGVGLGSCTYLGSDGFDNLRYETEACGDINGDTIVDVNDISLFAESLLLIESSVCFKNRSDINLDGSVNALDIQLFIDCALLNE